MKVDDCPYDVGGRKYAGKLVYDETSSNRRPIVVMGPNWMGVSDAAVDRARLLAEGRYAVFVADLYGQGRQPNSTDEAGQLAEALRRDTIGHRRIMSAALETATACATAAGIGDPALRAAIGFCVGGGSVLELARTGTALAAVVSIHGELTTHIPAGPGGLKTAILAFDGSEDPFSPQAHRDIFEAEMRAAGANWRLMVFGGLVHAFTDVGVDIPNIAKYDRAATRTTYEMTHAFLRDAFEGSQSGKPA
jgi:dienelactone hydrolase